MDVVLIRHGATEWNAEHRFQGRSDVALSALGRGHARAIAAALRHANIERLYSSDLNRALQTAQIVADASGAPVVTDARLREFDFGDWEGLTWGEIVSANPDLAVSGARAAEQYRPTNGESFAEVCGRVQSFLADMPSNADGTVAIVTHAGALHAFYSVLRLDESAAAKRRISFAPGGITRVAIEKGRARLLALNDVAHLVPRT